MVEISRCFFATMMVFSCYGTFRVGCDLSDLLTKKKWCWIPFILVILITGFLIFVKGYGKWFVLIN